MITPDGGTGVTVDSGSSSTAGADLSMTNMEFVQGTVTLEGANAIDVSNLRALTATLTLKQGGALDFQIESLGNVRIDSGTATIASIISLVLVLEESLRHPLVIYPVVQSLVL